MISRISHLFASTAATFTFTANSHSPDTVLLVPLLTCCCDGCYLLSLLLLLLLWTSSVKHEFMYLIHPVLLMYLGRTSLLMSAPAISRRTLTKEKKTRRPGEGDVTMSTMTVICSNSISKSWHCVHGGQRSKVKNYRTQRSLSEKGSTTIFLVTVSMYFRFFWYTQQQQKPEKVNNRAKRSLFSEAQKGTEHEWPSHDYTVCIRGKWNRIIERIRWMKNERQSVMTKGTSNGMAVGGWKGG